MEAILATLKSAEDKLAELNKLLASIDTEGATKRWETIGKRSKALAEGLKKAEDDLFWEKYSLLKTLYEASSSLDLNPAYSTQIGEWDGMGMNYPSQTIFLYRKDKPEVGVGGRRFCSFLEFEPLYYGICRQRAEAIEKYLTEMAPPQIAKTKEEAEKFKPLVVELSRLLRVVEGKAAA